MENRDETVFVNYEKLNQGQKQDTGSSKTQAEDAVAGELSEAYRRLGKAYYEGGFEDPLPELLPLFDQITRLKKAEEEAAALQFCPNCGQKVEKNASFCGKCGYRLK